MLGPMMHHRLRPLFDRLFVNSSRRYLEDFLRRAAASVPAGARVLDAGAGDGRYRTLFAHTHYEATDFCQVDKRYNFQKLDFVAHLQWLPTDAAAYDMIICTQVLEHLSEPALVLGQLQRALKPGGALWLSAPLFYAEHEAPHDYFRYTQYGLRHLLENAGFEVIQIEWLEGYYGTLAYQSFAAALALPIWPRHYGGGVIGLLAGGAALILKPLLAIASIGATELDLRQKVTHVGMCKNYAAIARKPAPP
jgi:2-polyprenyl-3-methyl-5-hydroxy-6-metoxy-1,4-benzoquinol methylase